MGSENQASHKCAHEQTMPQIKTLRPDRKKSLNIKEIAEAKHADAKTLLLLKSMSSSSQFKFVKKSGKSLARCVTWDHLCDDSHYFGKEMILKRLSTTFNEQNTLTGKEPKQNIRIFCTEELRSYLCEKQNM